ncbi:hypothetical protein [Microtetraspora malaysiensis]|uniref:hypothetical protein n=1 Tax=Microtetraspora malaysiensis TaxID=161358 RepID=UPI0012F8195F|nr:hypothetical protein [Microtetraspora malaysiensis]
MSLNGALSAPRLDDTIAPGLAGGPAYVAMCGVAGGLDGGVPTPHLSIISV